MLVSKHYTMEESIAQFKAIATSLQLDTKAEQKYIMEQLAKLQERQDKERENQLLLEREKIAKAAEREDKERETKPTRH